VLRSAVESLFAISDYLPAASLFFPALYSALPRSFAARAAIVVVGASVGWRWGRGRWCARKSA